jgi:DNA-binding Xre family transcriptional regulator
VEPAPGRANRGIWKASERQRQLADRGMKISAGKMSGLWSGQPNTIKLDELDVICAVLGCGVDELLLPEPHVVPQRATTSEEHRAAVGEARDRSRARPATRADQRLVTLHDPLHHRRPHEALTAGADPLHLLLVFNLSLSTASRYAGIAQHLLDDQLDDGRRH